MFLIKKAYANAKGKPEFYLLSHDIKRVLSETKSGSGLVTIVSAQGTTGLGIYENDPELLSQLMEYVTGEFASFSETKKPRRSGTGPDKFHLMASYFGGSITIPFEQGRLLTSFQQEVFAFDFDPKPGRREFIITAQVAGGQGAK